MRWYTAERLSPRQSLTPDGYLIVTDTIIARCGDQVYHASEVPLDPDDDGFVKVARDASEVFRPEAIASFEGKAITDDHPFEEVTPANHRELAIGHVQNVRRGVGADDDCLVADLVFTDPAAITKVRSRRKLALSCGYDARYERVARGRGAQKTIVGNHVALVDEGRCGSRCSIGDSGQAIFSYLAPKTHDAGCGCDACAHGDATDDAHVTRTPPARPTARRRLFLWIDGRLVWGRDKKGRSVSLDAGGWENEPRKGKGEGGGEWTTGGGGGGGTDPHHAMLTKVGFKPDVANPGSYHGDHIDPATMQQLDSHLKQHGYRHLSHTAAWMHPDMTHLAVTKNDPATGSTIRMTKPTQAGAGIGTGRAAAKRPSSVAFVSPSVAEHLDFGQAVSGLASNRQRVLAKASAEIDQALGLKSHDSPAVGAWSDGAENSLMTEVEGGTFDQLRVAAAMKAHIAQQKAALVFQQDPAGKAVLASFAAKGSLATIHDNLLADGVEFHTVIPTKDGATVYVADLDGSAHDAIEHAAQRYSATPEFQIGHAEFIPPDTKSDGSDAEQREFSQRGYESLIAGSGVEGSAALWQRIHHAYGASLQGVKDAYDPNEPRKGKGQAGGGEWTAGGGGGGATAGSTTFHKGNPVSTLPLNGKPLVSWGGDDLPQGNAGWDTLAANDSKDKPFDEPPLPKLTAGKHQGAGVIIREPDGRVWIVHPTNQYGGYKATFPKGTVEAGMSLRGTALKEAYEESGLGVRLTGYAGDIERDTSIARYYYAERMAGSPADAGWESEAVTLAPVSELKNHLNKKVDHDIVDLIIGKKPPKTYDPSKLGEPDMSTAAPAAPTDISKWNKTGGNLGSNPGGQYFDEQGKAHYVKLQKSNDHAKNEFLAARLYEAAGAPILNTQMVDLGGGKLGTETLWKAKQNIDLDNADHRKQAQRHFATHAWLANWDAIGMGQHENDWNQALIDGKMTTVDPGGALIYRAQGGPKGSAWGDNVGEWDTMRHGSNPQANKAFGEMTGPQLRQSVLDVAKVPDETIKDLTLKHGPGSYSERVALADRLLARKRDLIKRAMTTQDRRRGVRIHWDIAA